MTINFHRTVVELFVGPIPEGKMVAHLDGNPRNNVIENLMIATAAENHSHRILHGTDTRGEQCSWSKLTESQVRKILNTPINRGSQLALAREFGVSRMSIANVLNCETWKHIS